MSGEKKILVVEDDDETRVLLRMALARRGYAVFTAEDGVAGFEEVIRQRPDLIVTDISMPAADGAHLVRRVRDTPEVAETPILITTGFGTGNATFTLSQGANAYEPKPINPDSFMATVERLIGKDERGARSNDE